MERSPETSDVFVYGTLRPGERYYPRVSAWVTRVRPATTRGSMYHYADEGERGEFPYLRPGSDVIHGEVLSFASFPEVVGILDEIEGHPFLFRRRIVDVEYRDGGKGLAHAYFIATGEERRGRPIPGGDWKAESS